MNTPKKQFPQWISTTPDRVWQTKTCRRADAGTINLRPTETRRQRWEGFGGCFNELGWIAMSTLSATDRRQILRDLFHPTDGCRFNIGRLPIGASDYAAGWYSHNEAAGDFAMKHFSIERDHQHLIPYVRDALTLRPDLTLFASPWSPPTWMKVPPVYNYGTLVWSRENLTAYALYFAKFVQSYGRADLRIRQVHVQNEPLADQKFPSCIWTGAQLRDFIRDHLGPMFERQKLDCEIWLGTLNTGDYDGYPNTVLRDPAAYRYVAGVGLQWAGKEAAQRVTASWPEKRVWQTENECGNGHNTWDHARHVFTLLQHYLSNGISAYVYWNMVLAPGGCSSWGWPQNSMITVDPVARQVTYNPEFYIMKHFARFIEPGAVRLELSGSWAGNAVAFENPDGTQVYVINNPLPTPQPLALAARQQRITVTLAPGSYNTFVLPAA